jgi:serine/threonine protein phosphatase 1
MPSENEADLKSSTMSLTYAVGDIHGALQKIQRLIERCEQHAHSLADADADAMRFVFVGDYIDRGPDSSGVIELLIALAAKMPNRVVTVKGNHEGMLLAAIDGLVPVEHWLSQGGTATLRSYGAANVGDLPREHVDWLRAMPLSYDDGRRFFVHAGVDPERPLAAQDEDDLLWIREPFLSDIRDYGRLIVHGHTPQSQRVPDLRANRLNLDTGAGYGGPVTAAAFSDAVTPPVAILQAE